MEIRPSGQRRQGLVRRIAADVRAEVNRVTGLRQKFQVCAVGVVNTKEHAVLFADGGNALDVKHISEVVRACDVHGGRLFTRRKSFFNSRRRKGAGMVRPTFGKKPADFYSEQCARIHKSLVRIPAGKNKRFFAP